MTEALRTAAMRALAQLDARATSPIASCSTASTTTSGSGAAVVTTVVRGDASCLAVAAASCVAKVTRDEMMAEAAHHPVRLRVERRLPGACSTAALGYGLSAIHRRS